MLLDKLNDFTQSKMSWGLLFLSSSGLVLSALFFQHVLGHAPCVNCIYQRTAVIGLAFFAALPLLFPRSAVRLLAYLGWGVSAIWGWMVATEHVSILTAANPFFAPCPIVPNFPIPLYDWLPFIFGAPGDCLDQSWQFLGMGMPAWMQIIFFIYALIWASAVLLKMTVRKFKPRT